MSKKLFLVTSVLVFLLYFIGFGYLQAGQSSLGVENKKNNPTKIVMVKIAPNHRTMQVGTKKPFTANVIGKGKIDRSVTWSVEGGDANGTIMPKGIKKAIYEAPACIQEALENGIVTIIATSVSDSSKSGTAKIKLIGTECSSTTITTTTTSTTTTESSTSTTESSTTTTESSTTTSSTSSTTTTTTTTTSTITSTTTTTTSSTTTSTTTTTTTTSTTTTSSTTTTTTTTTSTTTTTVPGFSTVQGIFSANCTSCHGAGGIPHSPDLTQCSTASAAASLIKSEVDSGSMPPGDGLNPSDIAAIDAWVNGGASCL